MNDYDQSFKCSNCGANCTHKVNAYMNAGFDYVHVDCPVCGKKTIELVEEGDSK